MWTSVNQRMTFRGWELGPVKGSTITTKAQSLPILRIVYNLQWEIPVILADIHTEQVQINVQLHYMSLLVYSYLLTLVWIWNKKVCLCQPHSNLFLGPTGTKQWGCGFLLKETTGAFDGARTHDWQTSTLQVNCSFHYTMLLLLYCPFFFFSFFWFGYLQCTYVLM